MPVSPICIVLGETLVLFAEIVGPDNADQGYISTPTSTVRRALRSLFDSIFLGHADGARNMSVSRWMSHC